MKPTNFYHTTGHVDAITLEHAARRFTVAPARQSIHAGPLDLPHLCDICGKRRNQGSHQRCSRVRQQNSRRGAQ